MLLTDKSHHHGNGFFGTLFNLLNSTIGAALLSTPIAFQQSGILTSFFLFVLLIISLSYTYYLMAFIADDFEQTPEEPKLLNIINSDNPTDAESPCTPVSLAPGKVHLDADYISVSRKHLPYPFGTFFGWICEFCVFLFGFGCLLGYVIVIGQITAPLFQFLFGKTGNVFANVEFITGMIMIFIVFPLCLLRNLKMLSVVSSISIFAVLVMILMVFVTLIIRWTIPSTGVPHAPTIFGSKPTTILSTISLYTFSMGAHMVFFPLYRELNSNWRTPLKSTVICIADLILCFLMYAAFGIFGCLLFGDQIQDNILKNFELSHPFTMILRVLIAFIVILTFPLMHFCCRESILKVFFSSPLMISGGFQPDGIKRDEEFSYFRWITIAVIVCVSSYLIGISFPFITIIFSLTGATTGIVLFYCFPCVIYIVIQKCWWKRLIAVFVLCFGILLGIACCVGVTFDIVYAIRTKK